MKEKVKKLYSIPLFYDVMVKTFRSIPTLIKAKKHGLITEQFQERLMLAVTSVNKCAMCSYAHTEMALKAGLNNDEIRDYLSGELHNAPKDELKGILFAEHYADSRTRPSKATWDELVKEYDYPLAKAILSVVRVITFGNCIGIVFGSFGHRFTSKPSDSRSNIFYEIGIILSLLVFIPFALLQALFLGLIRYPIIKFRKQH